MARPLPILGENPQQQQQLLYKERKVIFISTLVFSPKRKKIMYVLLAPWT